MVSLDQLDKRILQHLSEGISSYEELARECNVTRNTIYRRMAALEKSGITQKTTRISINYDKIGISRINIALNVKQQKQEEIISVLKTHEKVKYLFKTYGTHNIVMVVLCDKGEEGTAINEVKEIAERYGASQIDVSVCFSWEKADSTPFAIERELVGQTEGMVVDQEMLVER